MKNLPRIPTRACCPCLVLICSTLNVVQTHAAAVASVTNSCAGCTGDTLVVEDVDPLNASANASGPTAGTSSARGNFEASAFARLGVDNTLNLGVFAQTNSTAGGNFSGVSSSARAIWTDTYNFSVALGDTAPDRLFFYFDVSGGAQLQGNQGDSSVHLSVDGNGSGNGFLVTEPNFNETVVLRSSPVFPIGGHYAALLDVSMWLSVSARNRSTAIGAFDQTLTLRTIKLQDGTSFDDAGVFASGMVPQTLAVPEPTSGSFIVTFGTLLGITSKRRRKHESFVSDTLHLAV